MVGGGGALRVEIWIPKSGSVAGAGPGVAGAGAGAAGAGAGAAGAGAVGAFAGPGAGADGVDGWSVIRCLLRVGSPLSIPL